MNKTEVLALIVTAAKEVMPELAGRSPTESDSLVELGANSLDRAEIVMAVLERMDLDISLVDTHGPADLGELAELLSRKSG